MKEKLIQKKNTMYDLKDYDEIQVSNISFKNLGSAKRISALVDSLISDELKVSMEEVGRLFHNAGLSYMPYNELVSHPRASERLKKLYGYVDSLEQVEKINIRLQVESSVALSEKDANA